ncbi:MAG: glycoside hydrolase family 3 C-terminal domain-containing protein [Bacteroidales bacterium]|nr:glycoside hydrolase family 3 C-terminal domain-containing protein [Bacteroidales bacterium]
MKNTSRILIALAAISFLVSCNNQVAPAIPADKGIEAKVEKTLKGMDLDAKIGQMVQLNIDLVTDDKGLDEAKMARVFGHWKIGSILNVYKGQAQTREKTAELISGIQEASMKYIGIPCIYGLDMIHGASYLSEATFFPQEVNIAATFDPVHAENMGRVMAYETRAAMCPWIFSPVMDLGRDPRWPRLWESFGEDAYLQSVMAVAETKAVQGEDPNEIGPEKVAACLKHYMAYGAPWTGKDRTPAILSEQDMREKFFRPFKESIEAGALSVMVNSASVNGVPTHANKTLLTDWLKDGLNWDGMIVTDWADVNNLFTREHIAADRKEALALAINAGIDMVMEPYDTLCCVDLKAAVEEKLIPMSRIDDAVRRVIRLKYRLGLFENPVWDTSAYDKYASEDFAAQARQAALESEVLLKNEGVLPIKKGSRILVTGPCANYMRSLSGGWSYTWQGTNDPAYVGRFNTIYEALSNKFGSDKVRYVPGVVFDESNWQVDKEQGISAAVSAARQADVVVACLGENSYCETPGNIDDLNLSENQKELLKAVASCGKPVVLVLNEGRPRIIGDIEPLAQAVVDVMLPSNYGADALAELLSGDANFSAKLPFTYPKHINSLHTYDYKVSELVSTMVGDYNYDAVMDVQWPFGTGLSYTSFEYSDLRCNKAEFKSGDVLEFELALKNVGEMAGKEAVLLYSSDMVASLVPDVRRLRAFDKVSLEPGESCLVKLSVPADDLAFVGLDGKWHLEKGSFRFAVANCSITLECTETTIK